MPLPPPPPQTARRDLLRAIPAPARSAQNAAEDKIRTPTDLPETRAVWTRRCNGVNAQSGDAFAWPRSGPLAIYMENTQEVAVIIDIQGGMSDDTGRVLSNPMRSISLGRGESRLVTLNPNGGDDWAPYVWAVVTAQAIALSGDLRIQFSRAGI